MMRGVDYKLVEIRNRFREYYNTELRHKYAELEPIRRKYLWKFCCQFMLITCLFLVYVFLCFGDILSKDFCRSKNVLRFYFLCIGCCFVIHSFGYKKETKLSVMDKILGFFGDFEYSCSFGCKRKIKLSIMDRILSFFCDFKYSYCSGFISANVIENSELFGCVNNQVEDDAFQGEYHGTKIKISEQKLCYNFLSDKHDVFRGVLLFLKFNKKVSEKVIVVDKRSKKGLIQDLFNKSMIIWWFFLIGVLYSLFLIREEFVEIPKNCFWLFIPMFVFILYPVVVWKKRYKVKSRREDINLEDVVFSKKWKVYADDQVEARYVLTPALMERMLAVKRLFHGNRLDFSFWGNNLLIAVHTNKDMFETTSLFNSALDYRKVQEVICQLYSVFSVIDVLKLQNESKKR